MLPYQTSIRQDDRIVIVGIGGAGANILQCFGGSSAANVRLCTMSLDERVGQNSGNVEFLQLGAGLNHGLGSGGDPGGAPAGTDHPPGDGRGLCPGGDPRQYAGGACHRGGAGGGGGTAAGGSASGGGGGDGLLRRSAGYQIDLDPDGHAGLYPAEIPADGLQRRPAVVPLIIRARPEPYFRHGGPSLWKILNSVIIPYPAALRKLRPWTLAENMEVRALRTRSKARRRGG